MRAMLFLFNGLLWRISDTLWYATRMVDLNIKNIILNNNSIIVMYVHANTALTIFYYFFSVRSFFVGDCYVADA